MPGRRRTLLLAVVCGVASAALLAAVRLFVVPPRRLGPGNPGTTTGLRDARVGERVNVFLGGFGPKGPDPVRVRAIRATGVPGVSGSPG